MKPLKSVLKSSTKFDLLETIRAALDCSSHFNKPEIVEKDPDFKLGDEAIVICGLCVDRMRDVLGLEEGDSNLSNFAYFYRSKGRKR